MIDLKQTASFILVDAAVATTILIGSTYAFPCLLFDHCFESGVLKGALPNDPCVRVLDCFMLFHKPVQRSLSALQQVLLSLCNGGK